MVRYGIHKQLSIVFIVILTTFFLGLAGPDFFLKPAQGEITDTSIIVTVCGNSIIESGE